MAGSQCNKHMGDKVKVIRVLGIRVMLLALRETMQADKQELLNATTVKMPGVSDCQALQNKSFQTTAAFQTRIFDTYDSSVMTIIRMLKSAHAMQDIEQPPAAFDGIGGKYPGLGRTFGEERKDYIYTKIYKEIFQTSGWRRIALADETTLYDGFVMSDKHVAMPVIDDEETLILEEESRALEILEFFKNNDLKAQLQDKDGTICKLKDMIKSIREKSKDENVKYDYCEIETKNVELKSSVAKLLSKNEHLCMFKLDLEPLAPRLLQNREIHIEYLKYTQEQADILRGIVEQAKAKQPLDKELYQHPLDDLEVTAAKVRVTAVKHNLVLLINFDETYAK
ncbi:hypothetical protein Tco_0784642 [Tanacetum coccineum]